MRKAFAPLILIAATSLGGCAQNLTAAFVYCEVEQPIKYSRLNDTLPTIAAVKEHNAVWHSLCPKR